MSEVKVNTELINMDAWSDGQMRSKLWLCDLLEKDFSQATKPVEIWIFGSWYGLLAQFLLLRERVSIKKIQLFDLDPTALKVSEKMLNTWIYQKKVEIIHHQMDCTRIPNSMWETKPDIVINTSCEHFTNESWFTFPQGTRFYIQSTNMEHPTHINRPKNLEDFKSHLGQVTQISYARQMEFRYTNFEFDRYMIAGIK
jgi:hypothetical protein